MYSFKRVKSFICVAVIIVALASIFAVPCEAQVTFSRDWNAGKRTIDSPECRSNIKSAIAICHMLVNEIRQLAGCEARAEDEAASSSAIFSGKR